MRFGKGIVGIADEGLIFTERPISEGKVRKVALKAVGRYKSTIPVGRITALQFVDDPRYPRGCSPPYGEGGRYETCRHCVSEGLCGVRGQIDMSDGSRASVVDIFRFNACESLVCWVFARFLNRYGWIYDGCVETYDNAVLDSGNEGSRPDLILFAGSQDGSLGLFVPGVYKAGSLPRLPFKVKVQSVNYWVQGESPKVVEWETTINGMGLFLIHFGNYVLPFRAYYSYPAGAEVKQGFSGSNAFLT
jgi:hypothetical protein